MAASEVSEGPVLSLISKRLRALRKKYNRIVQMEEALAQGKPINKEQEEVLRSKPTVCGLIDELEKLRQPLAAAVQEELALALQTQQPPVASPPASSVADESEIPAEAEQKKPESSDSMVEDLLNLLYFGSLFDVKSHSDFTSMCLTRTHERGCCLTYDYVTDEATDLLGERDLDLISKLGGLLISRPVNSGLSHRNALQHCIEHAKAWLANSDDPIEPNANITYSGLRERLQRIMSSDYFTRSPEMKGPSEVAAAAGNYAPFQVSVQGINVALPVQAESTIGQYQQKDEETAAFQEQETGGSQSSSVQEHQKDDFEAENPADNVSAQQEQGNQEVEVEHSQREMDMKEQQYNPRRGGYQNQRERGGRGSGGVRRGYPNGRGSRSGGRGGGPYQNGRNNQYYEQPGNYYPRGYHNNRGGGSGGGGRGSGQSYNHRGSAVQGGHNPSDVGVGA